MGNIRNVKQQYGAKEWDAREVYYTNELSLLVVPTDPSTKDVMQLNAAIDSLISEANLDLGYIDRNYQYFLALLKNAEKECFSIVKNSQLTQGSKATEADIKGLTVTYIKNNLLAGLPLDLYSVVQAAEKRYKFMEAVVSILKSKRDSILTINTMLKIESNI